jgi:hypothetical protein
LKGDEMAKSIMQRTPTKISLSANAIVQTADQLVAAREQWQQNEYARSNKRLYEILGSVLQMWLTVRDDKEVRTETVKQMKAALTAADVRIQANTLALTLFVRYVFRTDRQRAMNYCRTLQAAIAAGVNADGLADFIESNGGVEQCKRTVATSLEVVQKRQSIEDAMPLVEEMLQAKEQTPLATFKVSSDYVNGLQSGYIFVVARADNKGLVKALAAVPAQSEGVTKWAKQKMAEFLSKESAAAAKGAKARRKTEAINKATSAQNKTPTESETVGELLAA